MTHYDIVTHIRTCVTNDNTCYYVCYYYVSDVDSPLAAQPGPAVKINRSSHQALWLALASLTVSLTGPAAGRPEARVLPVPGGDRHRAVSP